MFFSKQFICATTEKNQYDKHVNAPLFRREFEVLKKAKSRIVICGLGFYRLFLNGKEITKGKFAPYISNPDQVLYYDAYNIDKFLIKGKNVLEVLLGNGLQNGIGGEIFGFDKALWASSPKLALALFNDDKLLFEADEKFQWREYPITFDDLWAGERYDVRLENNYKWKNVIFADCPKGETRDASHLSVAIKKEITPVKIFAYKNGYVFDFGLNTAGVCRLKIRANAGQKISLYHFEIFQNNEICTDNISFGKRTRERYWQLDEYITKDGLNVYEPSFTYHGFRYVYVEGLTHEQVKKTALKMLVLSSSAKNNLSYSFSDKRLEKLFSMVINSNQSNFFYYPTDCPHREKNGWTGDAMLSAEQMLISADYSNYLKEWLYCICKTQKEDGRLPRIVPTTEWGFSSGESGPNWDGALIELVYQLYKKDGNKQVIIDFLPSIKKYFNYLSNKRNEKGLISYGLGDREETFTNESSAHTTPNEVTDSLKTIELLEKAEFLAKEIDDKDFCLYAKNLRDELKQAFLTYRTDSDCKVVPFTQTGQTMLVSAKIFDGEKENKAFANLIELLKKNNAIKMGVLGYRKLFDVLASHNETEFAYRLFLSENYSGYLYYVKKGMTSMPESFLDYQEGNFVRKDGGKPLGLNHHWYGHILASIIKYVVGINSVDVKTKEVFISPCFVEDLKKVSISTSFSGENIKLTWKKRKKSILLKIKTSYKINLNFIKDYQIKSQKNGRYVLVEKGL